MTKLFKNHLIRLIVVLGSLVLVISLSRSIYDLWRKKDIIRQRELILSQMRTENDKLRQKLEEANDPVYIERQAREKLGLVKEGETLVIVPKQSASDQMNQSKEMLEKNLPNWKKWWRLFF